MLEKALNSTLDSQEPQRPAKTEATLWNESSAWFHFSRSFYQQALWEGLYFRELWKTLKKEKDELLSSSARQNMLKQPFSCHWPHLCSSQDGNSFLLRVSVRCLVISVEAVYTELALIFYIVFSALNLHFHHQFQRTPGFCAKESWIVSQKYRMLAGWLLCCRQCSHIPWQLGWSTTLWSRFKTWEKSVCSSPHFVSLELLPAQRLGWVHAKPGHSSGWILSWISVPAVQAQLSKTNPAMPRM